MTARKVKVLYIGGYARCGSTILSNVLGEVDGALNGGELMYIWDRILSEDGICGCGQHVTKCSVWGDILHAAFGPNLEVDCTQMAQMRNSVWQAKHLPMWLLSRKREKAMRGRVHPYLSALSRFYQAIGEKRTESIIIDSSKNPVYLYLLSLLDVVDLRVVHIVRDSRATAYSWLRKKKGFADVSTSRSSLRWGARNLAFDLLNRRLKDRYLRIRYEDFIADPQQLLSQILVFIDEAERSVDFIEEDGISFSQNHCVYGNPNLFKKGKVKLRIDNEWKGMGRRDWLVATALTFPVLKRYGYPVFD